MDINIYGDVFSKVYDRYWTDYIDDLTPEIIKYINKNISKSLEKPYILDLCCGTGRLSNKLFMNKFNVVGIDISENMIRVAKMNSSHSSMEFIIGDARDFNLNKKVDVVISTFDSLNHMNNLIELKDVFKSVRRSMNKNGLFMFDLNTAKNLRTWDFIDVDETDDLTIIMYGKFDKNRAYTMVSGFFKEKNNLYSKFNEMMINTIFKISEVYDLLESTGFTDILFYDPENLEIEILNPEDLDRVMITSKIN